MSGGPRRPDDDLPATQPAYGVAKCPWRVDVDPREIPRGYRVELHRALAETIAVPGDTTALADDASPPAMACQESPPGHETHFVG